jgi:hypothetical protein
MALGFRVPANHSIGTRYRRSVSGPRKSTARVLVQ